MKTAELSIEHSEKVQSIRSWKRIKCLLFINGEKHMAITLLGWRSDGYIYYSTSWQHPEQDNIKLARRFDNTMIALQPQLDHQPDESTAYCADLDEFWKHVEDYKNTMEAQGNHNFNF